MKAIDITKEMLAEAKVQASKRDKHIKHHFEVEHLTKEERDTIGFLGEFAGSVLLGQNWKDNIRKDYVTIDTCDIKHQGKLIDIKTETLPYDKLQRIKLNIIDDEEVYGRRLIHKGQVSLLPKYDIVIFGGFVRNKYDKWYPFGFLETKHILNNYKVTQNRPDGGLYPFAALPVKSTELKDIEEIL